MIENSTKKSLKYSFLEGLFASLMAGFTMNYVTPFALSLKATPFHIGVLSSFPILFASLIQLISAGISEKFNNRVKIVFWSDVFHAASMIPILFIPFIIKNYTLGIWLFIFFIALASLAGAIGLPVWSSLMSDTVPKENYGKYFAWRGKILGLVIIISGFAAGFFLDLFPRDSYYGFVTIFGVAILCRFFSGYYVGKMVDIPLTINDSDKFSYIDFVKRLPKSNFAKFVFYVASLHFGLFLAGPFFAVYMLTELQMTYSQYIVVMMSAAISGIISLPFWGYYSDKIGNEKIIKITSLFIVIVPFFWVFSSNFIYLTIINAIGGYIWAGFGLAMSNFIFDAVTPQKRTRGVAYFNVTTGTFMCLGALLGGYLIPYLPKIKGSGYLSIIFLSGCVRFIVYIFLSRTFHEVRKTEPVDEKEFVLTILWLKPILDMLNEVTHFNRIIKK